MRTLPGLLYKVGGRRYVDSQGLFNVAGVHELVPMANGWRVLAAAGAVHCALVEGRATLPRQRGALYELRAEGGASLKTERGTWLARGLVEAAGTFESWPGEPASACGSCGPRCGCGPCQQKHAHHDEEHG